MTRTHCCLFHSFGGPQTLTCDNYGRDGQNGVRADAVEEEEPVLTFGDLIEWDIYSAPEQEYGSLVAEAQETYGE
jgi:hypothetical protein